MIGHIENIIAGEALSAFDAVYVHTDGKAYKADADTPTNPAIGFVIAAAAINVNTQIAFDGIWDFETGLTQGETAYLSTTAGGVTGTRPTNGQALGYMVNDGRFKIAIQPYFTPTSVANGGTGASTITGLLQGNGTSAVTAITNSSTIGQALRVTGTSTYAWGAIDLTDSDAVTGVLPTANGGALPYKIYCAYIEQNDTNAPVATILENTLGVTPTWARAGTGIYTVTATGAWVTNKTALPESRVFIGGEDQDEVAASIWVRTSADVLTMRVVKPSIALESNIDMYVSGQNFTVTIKVYN